MSEDKFDAALELLRRLDPKNITENLDRVCQLIQSDHAPGSEELVLDLLSSVDTPLKVTTCPDSKKQFLCCDYNRDGDLYRSPYLNKFVPPTNDDDSPYPSPSLRKLEIRANSSFDIYRELYYEGSGLSSVYLWDTAEDEDADGLEEGFAGVVLIQKQTDDKSGKWDSIHVFEVTVESKSSAHYKVTTSVILDMANPESSSMSLAGTMTRQLESTQSLVNDSSDLEIAHLINLGQLIETSENNIRNMMQEVYFDKLKDILLKDVRSLGDTQELKAENAKHSDVIKGLQGL